MRGWRRFFGSLVDETKSESLAVKVAVVIGITLVLVLPGVFLLAALCLGDDEWERQIGGEE